MTWVSMATLVRLAMLSLAKPTRITFTEVDTETDMEAVWDTAADTAADTEVDTEAAVDMDPTGVVVIVTRTLDTTTKEEEIYGTQRLILDIHT
jgi:hypothetical protein